VIVDKSSALAEFDAYKILALDDGRSGLLNDKDETTFHNPANNTMIYRGDWNIV
jgi:hypothetical protein